ncbi:hypothetical protein Taro_009544 [Colocasia esculenta]|uniref:O-fucosyltransferase family protein n=1 Tax=Colocasia esculenta TaxID=4460 RepID=A0A843U151_COLES|nr:hypothetical protein [Colocasia esculenta]
MKEGHDGVGAVTESPLGQHLIKVIGNVCFSLFVLSVLVFTVIAVTYQPPDPWLDSSKAIVSRSFSQTLPNATFHPDTSLLTTAEDVDPSGAPLASPALADDAATTAIPPVVAEATALPVATNTTAPLVCDAGDQPLNCSHPAILAAIRTFNAKLFKSLVFLAYEIPVAGSKPDRCDVAWLFRNRKEKSWRKYRDYRWFRLAPADNCSFKVTGAGKFRSGTNASRRNRGAKGAAPSNSSRSPTASAPIVDSDINDTIPVVASESDFRKGRYLYYSRGGDYCKGMNHYLWSFLCGLGEAKFLNRTFVMDMSICLSATYNPSNKDEEGKDFRYYFDFEHLKESASVVEEGEFLRDWKRWDKVTSGPRKQRSAITVRKVPTYKVRPMQLKKDRSTILWRQFDGPEPENYWYRVCEARAAKYVQRPWHAIWKSKRLMNIVSEIAGKMDWDYDAVHVVRGEKANNKELWPNLDGDTSPDTLVDKLLKVIHPWRNLYIATNEPFYNYFDKLRSHYKVHLLDDYKDLWGNTSEWFNETKVLNPGRPVEFDGYMRVAVDTEVLYRAKTRVETFNNLTRDCKDVDQRSESTTPVLIFWRKVITIAVMERLGARQPFTKGNDDCWMQITTWW